MTSRVFCWSVGLWFVVLSACGGVDDLPADEVAAGAVAASAAQGGSAGQAGEAGQAGGGTTGSSDRFVKRVVSFTPGKGATFGQDEMPGVVMGPPVGTGELQGGTDVVSLGVGGEIVVELGVDAIDEPGADLIVFENAFYASGNPAAVWKELGEVSVSADGQQWATFPCEPKSLAESRCAGWHPVYSAPENGLSAFEPAVAGGDAFDLADVGVARARYVRIRDLTVAPTPPAAGFDLDAVAVIHPAP